MKEASPKLVVLPDPEALGRAAAGQAIDFINRALTQKGSANIILATGASQFATLKYLVQTEKIDWSRVHMFHLDEYIGLPAEHPASFRKYLKERFTDIIGPLGGAHFIRGDAEDLDAEISRINELITGHPIDVALIGIGENGHLAFNDPPADFQTEKPFIRVTLDEDCRKQQSGEGWFDSPGAVPQTAISMSIRQIMKSKHLIVSVPDRRKANAVQQTLQGKLTSQCPASVLREHPSCYLYLDHSSASLL